MTVCARLECVLGQAWLWLLLNALPDLILLLTAVTSPQLCGTMSSEVRNTRPNPGHS